MTRTIACILLLLASTTALAQRGGADRRIYCWEQDGHKVCGDTLPASAVDAARTEIRGATGNRRVHVERALSPEERSQAQAEARRIAAEVAAEAAARRRDIAMVDAYNSEDELRRAYDNRIVLIDESIKTSRMGLDNLRMSLLTQLRQATEQELHGRAVSRPLAGNIRSQHTDLLRQQAILEQQLQDRAMIDSDLEDALDRYRQLTARRGHRNN